jgi:uncharacterized membrane protein YozB (DUF420 family)
MRAMEVVLVVGWTLLAGVTIWGATRTIRGYMVGLAAAAVVLWPAEMAVRDGTPDALSTAFIVTLAGAILFALHAIAKRHDKSARRRAIRIARGLLLYFLLLLVVSVGLALQLMGQASASAP